MNEGGCDLEVRTSLSFQVSQIIPFWTVSHTEAGAMPADLIRIPAVTESGLAATERLNSLLITQQVTSSGPAFLKLSRVQEPPGDHVKMQTRAQ